jgi:hypothetical protein
MMKLETGSGRDWQGFSHILEVMSFLDEIENYSPDQIRKSIEGFCHLPPNPGQTMSLEEVVFWAGVASGMEFMRYHEEEIMDADATEKMLLFASIFSQSMKNAIVDLALGELESGAHRPRGNWGSRIGR